MNQLLSPLNCWSRVMCAVLRLTGVERHKKHDEHENPAEHLHSSATRPASSPVFVTIKFSNRNSSTTRHLFPEQLSIEIKRSLNNPGQNNAAHHAKHPADSKHGPHSLLKNRALLMGLHKSGGNYAFCEVARQALCI